MVPVQGLTTLPWCAAPIKEGMFIKAGYYTADELKAILERWLRSEKEQDK